MKIAVLGSIGYGGYSEIVSLTDKLIEKEFDVVKQIDSNEMNYSDIDDFRDKIDLSKKIVEHDIKVIEKVDILVLITSKPSFGASIEIYRGKELNKTVILFSKDEIPTPWPVAYSDFIVRTEEELISLLLKLRENSI